jgi:hypothetical protein
MLLEREAQPRWGRALEPRIWCCPPAKPHLAVTDLVSYSYSAVADKVIADVAQAVRDPAWAWTRSTTTKTAGRLDTELAGALHPFLLLL